ncbi:MAG TPA: translation elongation factor Ts [Thermoanaerobaculaceae bacterium]|nr:translation elongation factor Ts [Thermoanaerobaculaceae bacterium]
MAITAAQVKELREKTGAGMMDCQRALQESNGDMEEAVKILRKKGLSAAAKKAGRTAKEGLITIAVIEDGRRGGMVELNCETDFVARTEQYKAFAQALADQVAADGNGDIDKVKAARYVADPLHTVGEAVASQVATIGENILLSRVGFMAAEPGTKIGSYLHMGGKIGVLVEVSEGADDETVKDVAMQVAAAEPRWVSREAVPAAAVAEEREIAKAQAATSGKPAQVIEKIAEGKVGKFYEQVCLVEQPFVKDPAKKVSAVLAERGGVAVKGFLRFKLGEGAGAAEK